MGSNQFAIPLQDIELDNDGNVVIKHPEFAKALQDQAHDLGYAGVDAASNYGLCGIHFNMTCGNMFCSSSDLSGSLIHPAPDGAVKVKDSDLSKAVLEAKTAGVANVGLAVREIKKND